MVRSWWLGWEQICMRWRFFGTGAALVALPFVLNVSWCSLPQARAQFGGAPLTTARATSPSELAEEFDQSIFGAMPQAALSAARKRLTEAVTRKAAAIGRAGVLSEVQCEKLRLAGELDVKRLWDRLDDARQAYIDAGSNGPNDHWEISKMDAWRHQLRFGPFGEDSLFEKTRRRLLSSERGKAWEAHRERDARSTTKITAENACLLECVGRVSRDLYSLVRSPNDGRLGLVTFDKPVEICAGLDFKTRQTVGDGRRAVAFDFNPERQVVAIGENSTKAILVNLATGKEIEIQTGNQQPHAEFSPDGTLLVTGGYGKRAKLWSAASGKHVRDFDAGPFAGGLRPVFSPDGRIVAIGNRNSTTELFDVATGELLRVLHRSQSQELKFDPSGKRLAVTYVNGSLGLWDVASGELIKIADAKAAELYSVDWSPDGKLIATSGRQASVCLWNAENLEVVHEIESPEWVICVRFNREGTRLLFAGGAEMRGGERSVRIFAVPE